MKMTRPNKNMVVCLLILLLFCGAAFQAGAARRPIVIGHRGASGYLPEHTLASYRLAIDQGADYIEPDLVPTKDGVLVARHENDITETTDVAQRPDFASRKCTKTVDGKAITGWFTEDFSASELRTLRTKGRTREGRLLDGHYSVPTFEEILVFVAQEEQRVHRKIGIYPETKHPTYFRKIGLPLEDRMLDLLKRFHYDRPDSPCFIQSFEVANLQALKGRTPLPLMQLIDDEGSPWDFVEAGDPRSYQDMLTTGGLREIASYAKGIAISNRLAFNLEPDGSLGSPTGLITAAHGQGLMVHGWTFRAENRYLPLDYRVGTDPEGFGDLAGLMRRFYEAGMDGAFCNHPDFGVRALKVKP